MGVSIPTSVDRGKSQHDSSGRTERKIQVEQGEQKVHVTCDNCDICFSNQCLHWLHLHEKSKKKRWTTHNHDKITALQSEGISFPVTQLTLSNKQHRYKIVCDVIRQRISVLETSNLKLGTFCKCPKRLLRTGSLHLKSALAGFSRVSKGFAGNQWKLQKIAGPPTFTNAVCVLCLQPRISSSTCPTVSPLTYLDVSGIFCLMFPSQDYVAPLLSHFPNISNKIPYNSSNFTPKEETRLQKAANSWKSGLKKRGKLQFLQESPQESCSFCKSASDLTLRAA